MLRGLSALNAGPGPVNRRPPPGGAACQSRTIGKNRRGIFRIPVYRTAGSVPASLLYEKRRTDFGIASTHH